MWIFARVSMLNAFSVSVSALPVGHGEFTSKECTKLMADTAAACRAANRNFSITHFLERGFSPSESSKPIDKTPDVEAELALNHSYPGLRALDVEHSVYVVDSFLTDADRDRFISSAESFVDSPLLGAKKQSSSAPLDAVSADESRSETSTDLHKGCDAHIRDSEPCSRVGIRNSFQAKVNASARLQLDAILKPKLAALLPGISGNHCHEKFKLSKYEQGGYYSEHGDGRRATVLVFLGSGDLNDTLPVQGGSTYFSRLNLRVAPHPGRALIFFPTYANGKRKSAMLHAAEEVIVGQKYVVQQWLNLPGQQSESHKCFMKGSIKEL
eukprot:gnl/TRDRNA2_/TRDRNA2_32866_c0_seq1.p1 gnl/TRDRNA2_/TRDRNA2_32866_c0~~gnl/TRDRNA2_/TRDRNA2_32866_c0_seq1.p1  ORF type:complete len:326 (-),score=43.16 gnl/TRDRNA2_/TRDRNA2_32866_c0_seq1:14-991(-)